GAGHGRRTGGGAAAGGEREEKDGNYEVALRDQDQSSHLTLADLAIESAEVPEDIMVETRQIRIRDGDVLVLVGTMKGAFLFRSDARRSRWEMGGPFFAGQPVYALAYDGRAGRRRPLPAHGAAAPDAQGHRSRGDLHRGRVPHGRRRQELAHGPQGRARAVPARPASRVRPVRAQGRPAFRAAGPDVPAEPLGP